MSSSQQKTILAADDDGMYLEIVAASNGVEALDIIQKSAPDLLITDLDMPKVTGLQLAEESRRLGYQFPIICASSEVNLYTLERFVKIGARMLSKPFPPQALLRMIKTVLPEEPILA